MGVLMIGALLFLFVFGPLTVGNSQLLAFWGDETLSLRGEDHRTVGEPSPTYADYQEEGTLQKPYVPGA